MPFSLYLAIAAASAIAAAPCNVDMARARFNSDFFVAGAEAA